MKDEDPSVFPRSCQEVTQAALVSLRPLGDKPGSISDGAVKRTGPGACHSFPVGGAGMGGTGCRSEKAVRLLSSAFAEMKCKQTGVVAGQDVGEHKEKRRQRF